jgi:hypothetical protein
VNSRESKSSTFMVVLLFVSGLLSLIYSLVVLIGAFH